MINPTYLDSGFDNYFQRELIPMSLSDNPNDISQYDFASQYQGISASQIISGLLQSKNGRVKLDLDEETFIVSDGLVDRVRLGKLPDGSYGLLILDANGNTIMQISGNVNFIKSSDGSLEINFDNTQILVRNEGGLIKVLLGKDLNGF